MDSDNMTLEEFEAELDRVNAIQNSILYQALVSAELVAARLYTSRRNAIYEALGYDFYSYPPDMPQDQHLALLKEYEAANNQIKAWRRKLLSKPDEKGESK